MICHYWLFNQGFKFQDSLCNGCHDLLILCLNKSSITIVTVFSVFLSQFFFYFFCFNIYKLDDSEYNIDIFKSIKISIGTMIKNPEMLQFVLVILKLKNG